MYEIVKVTTESRRTEAHAVSLSTVYEGNRRQDKKTLNEHEIDATFTSQRKDKQQLTQREDEYRPGKQVEHQNPVEDQ